MHYQNKTRFPLCCSLWWMADGGVSVCLHSTASCFNSPWNWQNFHLSDVHITFTCYKNLFVHRARTNCHPIFFEPIMLHGQSSTNTFFFQFLHHLKGKFERSDATLSKLVVGSDKEAARRAALSKAFPGALHLSCVRRLEQNFSRYLNDKVGMTEATCAKSLSMRFLEWRV